MTYRCGKMNDERGLFTQHADLLLHILNQQRHDLLNYFQVLLSYLKLGRAEEGEAYLKRIVAEMQQMSHIARVNCPLLSVFFLTFNNIHKELNLEVQIDEQLDLSLLHQEQQHFIMDLTMAVKNNLVCDQPDHPSLIAFLAPDETGVKIGMELFGYVSPLIRQEVDSLLPKGKQAQAIIERYEHVEDQWVLEVHFPCRKQER